MPTLLLNKALVPSALFSNHTAGSLVATTWHIEEVDIHWISYARTRQHFLRLARHNSDGAAVAILRSINVSQATPANSTHTACVQTCVWTCVQTCV